MPRLADDIQQRKPFRSPQEQLLLEIVHTADMLWSQVAEFLKPYGLSSTQYNALRILRGAGADGLPCGEVGNRMVKREPDITRLLDRLERQNWIERRRQTDDRRVVRAWLTPAGADLLAKIDEPLKEFQARQLRHLKRSEILDVIQMMERVRDQPQSKD